MTRSMLIGVGWSGLLEMRWRNCLASGRRLAVVDAYVDMAWKLSGDRTGRPVGSGRTSTTGKRHGCGRSSTKKAPRRWGSPPRCGPAGPSPS